MRKENDDLKWPWITIKKGFIDSEYKHRDSALGQLTITNFCFTCKRGNLQTDLSTRVISHSLGFKEGEKYLTTLCKCQANLLS